jgi:catechol 2,3-dioxygenase-like lactoylglutathione lyase family enzyme
LNHHIVAARDNEATARYFTEILGLEPAVRPGEFAVLRVSPDTTLDFVDDKGDFDRLHYALLVTEAEFDEIFAQYPGRRTRGAFRRPQPTPPGSSHPSVWQRRYRRQASASARGPDH